QNAFVRSLSESLSRACMPPHAHSKSVTHVPLAFCHPCTLSGPQERLRTMIKNFLAYDLATKLYDSLEPIALKPTLKDQLDRASQSIVLNLAEGSGKPTERERKRFYSIAFGSIREVQAIAQVGRIEDKQTLATLDHLAACVFR